MASLAAAQFAPYLAYGTRGISKLVETLRMDQSTVEVTRSNISTLNGLLSHQENKAQALENDGVVVPVLTTFLSSDDTDTRREAALALGSLALIFQGRIAMVDAKSVGPLSGRLAGGGDESAEVREASSAALLALSASRDGCAALMQSPGIITILTKALKDDHVAVVRHSLESLANLLRLDLGIDEALAAHIMSDLANIVDQSNSDVDLLQKALQVLWNLANTPDGKIAAIDAGLLPVLSWHCVNGVADVRRLAAGCVLAITISKEGKLNAASCLEPLAQLLVDKESDASTIRNAVGALKNITEYPKLRRKLDRFLEKSGIKGEMGEHFEKVLHDDKCWPASVRYEHQNVAPGGEATTAEAEQRARWGYPKAFQARA